MAINSSHKSQFRQCELPTPNTYHMFLENKLLNKLNQEAIKANTAFKIIPMTIAIRYDKSEHIQPTNHILSKLPPIPVGRASSPTLL